MNYTENGIKAIQGGNFSDAFNLLKTGFFENGEEKAGCYLAQMYYDTKITPRTEKSLLEAMLLWCITKDIVPSSRHKLGVTLYSAKNQEARNDGLQMIQQASNEGYQVSFCVLGVLSYTKKDYDTAYSYFSKYESIKTDQQALKMFGDCCAKMSIPNIEMAESLISQCGESFNDADAYQMISEIYQMPQNLNPQKSLHYSELAAEAGNIDAMFTVGQMYYEGKDKNSQYPDADDQKALKYFSMASTKGNAKAMKKLAYMYCDSRGVAQNYDEAIKLLQNAQKLGEQCNSELGFIYLRQEKVQLAYSCFMAARKNGESVFYDDLFYCARVLESNNQISYKELLSLALYCEKESPQITDDMAIVLSELYYYDNDTVSPDYQKAESYALQVQCPQSDYIVGKLAAYGKSNRLKPADAEEYLKRAADAGYVDAMLILGKLYAVWNLYTRSVNMLMKAYNNGCKEAAHEISELYATGMVTGRADSKKAAEWEAKAQ